MMRKELRNGEILFRKGTKGSAFLIWRGAFEIYGEGVSIQVGEGELIGLAGLIDEPYQGSAKALEDAVVYPIDAEGLAAIIADDPSDGVVILRSLLRRFAQFVKQLKNSDD
ncbi:MAG: cyclic nucleotide-binding domain-containing protein [Alphaproteobacteria bacterium]|nr:cyclic nucleotide-binding domain-containing protein [Alphaproteobacteria bacterium]